MHASPHVSLNSILNTVFPHKVPNSLVKQKIYLFAQKRLNKFSQNLAVFWLLFTAIWVFLIASEINHCFLKLICGCQSASWLHQRQEPGRHEHSKSHDDYKKAWHLHSDRLQENNSLWLSWLIVPYFSFPSTSPGTSLPCIKKGRKGCTPTANIGHWSCLLSLIFLICHW